MYKRQTLGNISTAHVSIPSADVGLAQLAMHSAFETAGVKDTAALAAVSYTHLDVYKRQPLKRAIQTQIEDKLAEEILSGRIVSGDSVSAGFREGKVTFLVHADRAEG